MWNWKGSGNDPEQHGDGGSRTIGNFGERESRSRRLLETRNERGSAFVTSRGVP